MLQKLLALFLFFTLFLPSTAQATFYDPKPIIKLKPVELTNTLLQPIFSWQIIDDNPPIEHTFYLDMDKNKIFTDQAMLNKNIGDVFDYTLSDAEALTDIAQTYFWGIKAQDNAGKTGYSEIIAFSPIILKYEPILYFHPDEDFYPLDVESFVSFASLWDAKGSSPDEKIISEYRVNLDDLSPEGIATSDWYLQFSEDLIDKTPDPEQAKQEYQLMRNYYNDAPYTYYAYIIEDSFIDDDGQTHSFIVLEYWYFYAFNDFGAKVEGGNNHEGDWECVMIFLDKASQEPKYVAYSQHHNAGRIGDPLGEPPYIAALQFDSVRRTWNSNEVIKEGDKIISFVGLGSHANYPNNNNGIHPIPLYPDDLTSYDGKYFFVSDWQQKYLFEKTNFPNWLIDYKGYWGVIYPTFNSKIQSGSKGPYYSEYDKFNHPVQWAALDKINKKTVMEIGTQTLDFTTSQAKMVFNKTLEIGTEIMADFHNEIISFGENIKNLQLAPRFWDFTSNLIPNTFQAEITLKFDPQELQDFGFDDLAKLTVYTFNETLNNWTVVPTIVDLVNSAVKFQTTHFSYYGLGLLPEQEPPVDFKDITNQVKVVIESKKGKYNKTTGQKEISVIMINQTEENIAGDLRLAIADIDKDGVKLLNPDGLTEQGKPYIDFSQTYDQCAFTGTEQNLPADIKNSLKRRLLEKFIRYQKRCDKILTLYPELAPFLKLNILSPKEATKAKILQFSVPTKKERYFEVEWEVWNKK